MIDNNYLQLVPSQELHNLEMLLRQKERQIQEMHTQHMAEIERLDRKLNHRNETLKKVLLHKSKVIRKWWHFLQLEKRFCYTSSFESHRNLPYTLYTWKFDAQIIVNRSYWCHSLPILAFVHMHMFMIGITKTNKHAYIIDIADFEDKNSIDCYSAVQMSMIVVF